jgi:hypothetical protein
MIRLTPRNDAGQRFLILLSSAILACSLLYALFVPAPGAAGVASARVGSRRKIQEEIVSVRARTKRIEAAIQPRLWRGDAEIVTAIVLEQLTGEANRRKVKLSAFRPQRPQTLEGMTELPFSVHLSGPYPAVRAIMAALDAAGSRLALRSVQVASSDGASNAVTATLGLSAYIRREMSSPAGSTKGTARD